MDGKGRSIDNVFIKRLWQSLKYACVCLHAWGTGSQAKAGIARWMTFCNHYRPHANRRENDPPDRFLTLLILGGTPPAVFYHRAINETQTDQQLQKVA